MAILPPESSTLLPSVLGNLMTNRLSSIHYMYPLTYKYDYINKKFLWECPPVLPEIDLDKLESCVNYYSKFLSPDDLKRNSG